MFQKIGLAEKQLIPELNAQIQQYFKQCLHVLEILQVEYKPSNCNQVRIQEKWWLFSDNMRTESMSLLACREICGHAHWWNCLGPDHMPVPGYCESLRQVVDQFLKNGGNRSGSTNYGNISEGWLRFDMRKTSCSFTGQDHWWSATVDQSYPCCF